MSEMVERAGRAVHEAITNLGGMEQAGIPDYESVARAVMKTMREPTEAMVAAGNKCTDWASGADDAWEAMIDEALK